MKSSFHNTISRISLLCLQSNTLS